MKYSRFENTPNIHVVTKTAVHSMQKWSVSTDLVTTVQDSVLHN